jgi:hypothetical protein
MFNTHFLLLVKLEHLAVPVAVMACFDGSKEGLANGNRPELAAATSVRDVEENK